MATVMDEETAGQAPSGQVQNDEDASSDASFSVASRSTHYIVDVDAAVSGGGALRKLLHPILSFHRPPPSAAGASSTGASSTGASSTTDRTAGAAAAAVGTAPTKFRKPRKMNVFAFCGTVALLVLVMGITFATMGDTATEQELPDNIAGINAGEQQAVNPSPPEDAAADGSPVEGEAAGASVVGGAPEGGADAPPKLIAELPSSSNTAIAIASDVSDGPTEAPTAPPTVPPTASPTASSTTAPPTTAPTEEESDDFWGLGLFDAGGGDEGDDDFWGLGGGGDGDEDDDFWGFLGLGGGGDGDEDDDFWGLGGGGDDDEDDDFWGLGGGSDDGGGDDRDDLGDFSGAADEPSCFDDVICCFTFGLFC